MKWLLGFAIIPICYASEDDQNWLTMEQRKFLIKTHAILMIIGWLFLVPTGFLFARLGRDLYKGKKLFGSPVWFQIHRVTNFIAVLCISISMFCIFLAQSFQWRGTGSSARYWAQWHTDLGTISTILAVAQPLNSLLRCAPTDSNRKYFNWSHRIVGVLAYFLAFATLLIAGLIFKKAWDKPLVVLTMISLPTVVSLGVLIGFGFLERAELRNRKSQQREVQLEKNENSLLPMKPVQLEDTEPHILRIPAIFMSIGAFFASATSLSLLIAN